MNRYTDFQVMYVVLRNMRRGWRHPTSGKLHVCVPGAQDVSVFHCLCGMRSWGAELQVTPRLSCRVEEISCPRCLKVLAAILEHYAASAWAKGASEPMRPGMPEPPCRPRRVRVRRVLGT
jgi:hypothetical protein